MTIGVGGSSFEAELARLNPMTSGIAPIAVTEFKARIEKAQALLREQGLQALYLDTSANLHYFTGIQLKLTERLHGAIIPAEGDIVYLSPAFEEPKTREYMQFGEDVRCWEEHEDPTALVVETIRSLGYESGTVALDPHTPFFIADGLRKAGNRYSFASGGPIAASCRQLKSAAEIALIQRAMDITMEVHRAAARVLRVGLTTTELVEFLDRAHRKLGLASTFGAAQFGEATAYPHGVPYAQTLAEGDMVLIDTGTRLGGYHSDITRTYVFGEPTERQREIWNLEKRAQLAGFEAAVLGAPCENVDQAARGVIEAAGYGPGYKVPGLPHRTGHGLGLEIHEEPFMVKGSRTPLAAGMCFSVEPMMCIYGEFGVRLEDIAYMAEGGARWFTQPAHSVDDPFGYEA
ncbi:Xaa-Pro peptidase family protein [Bosea sp. BIWAKO-01]|uniref:M24 family metallopeptidase n=1 Tax=Bosea sp. BIWAKO-01 TaxID=506668 RepID=UPI000852CD16|nr:Xaa-Pro peptidase family protein [Bosea sp. BIWAKO-01]GAU86068.1 proline dipeptidase [Bosea sp. BIWAKO-01]